MPPKIHSSCWITNLAMSSSDFWQHTGQNLETKVFLVSQSIGPALDDSDLVVDPLDETQRNFVLLVTIRLDAVPVGLYHRGELAKGLQPLPLQSIFPVVEEPASPTRPIVVPELAERLLQEVRNGTEITSRVS